MAAITTRLFTRSEFYGLETGMTISGFGDSICAQGIYQPISSSLNNTPQWAANSVYAAGNTIQNNGLPYTCSTGGTSASSGGPTGVNASITDGTVNWKYLAPTSLRSANNFLYWVEKFTNGSVRWNQSQGYQGLQGTLLAVNVLSGGTGYINPTVTFNNGATGTVQSVGGVITGVNITNPGFTPSTSFTYSFGGGGSGASIGFIAQPAGTFGVSGDTTSGAVARLPDAVASTVDIFVIQVGTNDLTANVPYATIQQNLQTIYETLLKAGKTIIAMPIMPRASAQLTQNQRIVQMRVNRWMRAYYWKESWANPNRHVIGLADAERYWTDGTNGANNPIGQATAAANAMAYDGLHPSPRGASYMALAIIQQIQTIASSLIFTQPRTASYFDGYDSLLNVGGNCLEALPWTASTPYIIGQSVSNSSRIYRCTGSGTSSSSTGPTGTGTITDGSVTWVSTFQQGLSIPGASGNAGSFTAATGITFTGNLNTGMTLARNSGTSTGTVTGSIENPWSDGQTGQRQSLVFALASGTNNEWWQLKVNASTAQGFGIQSSDLGLSGSFFTAECEVDISGVSNLTNLSLQLWDSGLPNVSFRAEDGYVATANTGVSYNLLNSTSEMLPYPNSGRLFLRTEPFQIPSNQAAIQLYLSLGFNTASSAALTLKVNYLGLRKDFQA